MSDGSRVLQSPSGGAPYRFDPGCFSLELLVTGGPGAYERYELWRTPADLAAWLADSRLTLGGPLRTDDFRIRPAEFVRIKGFRDVLWSVARAVAHGDQPSRQDLELINAAVLPPPAPRVDLDTGARAWTTPITGAQVLGAAARDAVDVITTDLAKRVRECAAGDCYLIFLDTSRPGTRRWCSMQRCGNLHKVNTYRSRT